MSPQTAPPKGSYIFTLVAFVRNALTIKVIFAMIKTKIFQNRYRFFVQYQNFLKPIPILFLIPKFSETDTDTFFDTKNFWNQYRYFFRNQKISKPKPILFSIPNFFKTDTDTFFWNQNFSNWNRYLFYTKNFGNRFWYHRNNWKSFETEKFRKQNVTLWY